MENCSIKGTLLFQLDSPVLQEGDFFFRLHISWENFLTVAIWTNKVYILIRRFPRTNKKAQLHVSIVSKAFGVSGQYRRIEREFSFPTTLESEVISIVYKHSADLGDWSKRMTHYVIKTDWFNYGQMLHQLFHMLL